MFSLEVSSNSSCNFFFLSDFLPVDWWETWQLFLSQALKTNAVYAYLQRKKAQLHISSEALRDKSSMQYNLEVDCLHVIFLLDKL